MYLIKATPDQVSKHWGLFKFAIAESMPPSEVPTEETLLQILQSVLSGRMQLWIANRDGYPVKTIGVTTTLVCADSITGTRALMIFSAYTWSKMEMKDWEDGFETLCKFALSEGCSRLELHTGNEMVKRILSNLGYFTQHTYAVVQIGE